MRVNGLIKRNFLEIIRDPLTITLGIGFPSIMLILFSIINISTNLPFELFNINFLVSGIAVFGFSFLMMFCAMMIAKDRQTSLFARFQTLPLRPFDFVLAYSIPFIPPAILQIVITYGIGLIFGLQLSWGLLLTIFILLPVAITFIGIGIIMGSALTENQISGIGTILINICTLLSGAWFDINAMGGFLKTLAYCFPFARAVDASRSLINSTPFNYTHLIVIIAYMIVICAIAILLFSRKIKFKNIQKK